MSERRFNFEEFYISIIKSIDTIRSKKNGEFVESRIDAFYRALGLPAISINNKIPKDDLHNYNIYPDYTENDNKRKTNVIARQQEIFNNQKFTLNDEIGNYLKSQNLSIKDSVNDSNARANSKILPLYSNAEKEVWPKSNRVCAAFADENDIVADGGKVRYKRPFIESVITIRLKVSGLNRYNDFGNATQVVEDNLSELSKYTLSKLDDLKSCIDTVLLKAIQNANLARKNTGVDISPLNNTSGIDQNPMVAEGQTFGEIDKKKKMIEAQMIRNRARMAIFDFDDTLKNDGDNSSLKNMTGPMFSGDILNIAIGEEIDQEELDNVNMQLKKNENILKVAYTDVDSIIGKYSGLSGVDIIAIILGLFKLEEKYLVGLLNDTGRENLVKIKGAAATKDAATIPDSIGKLEELVMEIIDDISTDISKTKPKDKLANKEQSKQTK